MRPQFLPLQLNYQICLSTASASKRAYSSLHGSFFGNSKVRPEERQAKVNSVFTSVASKYDLMNDLMSLGLHRIWKKTLLDKIEQRGYLDKSGNSSASKHMNETEELKDDASDQLILDVAGGTGDVAIRLLERMGRLASSQSNSSNAQVAIVDINEAMLHQGRETRIKKFGRDPISQLIVANAENLPFKEESVYLYVNSFGMRNVTDIYMALKEAHRVLKKGHPIFIMEFSPISKQKSSPANLLEFGMINWSMSQHIVSRLYPRMALETAYGQWAKLLPLMGQIVANDHASYRKIVAYLQILGREHREISWAVGI